jgi:hypothetical protein
MKKERYLSPKTCSIVELETECLQTTSKVMFKTLVDPLDEEGNYFDAEEGTGTDHLIVL